MSKHSYKNLNYFDQIVSSDVQTLAIDCFMMDTASFVMQFPAGLQCDVEIQGSIDGVTFVDMGVIIQPLDGLAAETRYANVFQNALSFIRVALTSVTGSGQVVIKAQAKGFA
jgi:hypothetical protein